MSSFPKPGADNLEGRRAEIAFNYGEDELTIWFYSESPPFQSFLILRAI